MHFIAIISDVSLIIVACTVHKIKTKINLEHSSAQKGLFLINSLGHRTTIAIIINKHDTTNTEQNI